jgi:hypothetical protein
MMNGKPKPHKFVRGEAAKSGTRLLPLRGVRDFARDRSLPSKIRVGTDTIVLRATRGIPDNLHHPLAESLRVIETTE